MIILDTDCLSRFDREKYLETSRLREHLAKFPASDIFVSIITFEEQMRGWMAYIARCRTKNEQIFAYERLHQFIRNFREIPIVDFDDRSFETLTDLKSQKIRVGTMDLKIAAIALANDAILISRNLADFERIPGLTVYDWTV